MMGSEARRVPPRKPAGLPLQLRHPTLVVAGGAKESRDRTEG